MIHDLQTQNINKQIKEKSPTRKSSFKSVGNPLHSNLIEKRKFEVDSVAKKSNSFSHVFWITHNIRQLRFHIIFVGLRIESELETLSCHTIFFCVQLPLFYCKLKTEM